MGFPGGASGKEPACQCRRRGFVPWVGKTPWGRAWQSTPVFFPGESHGQTKPYIFQNDLLMDHLGKMKDENFKLNKMHKKDAMEIGRAHV